MINFKHYSEDAFTLYKDAVERKTGHGKDGLKRMEEKVKSAYDSYNSAFGQKHVHTLLPSDLFSEEEKELLEGMFDSDNKIVRTIREWIDANNNRTYLNRCPYCTLNAANTTEHILPKSVYEEFAVHALNLIPCCSECNSKKGDNFKDRSGNPLFLNFYYDILPEKQYLFVDLSFDGKGVVNFNYRLDNVNHIDVRLFNLICRHYEKLDLLTRFKTKAISEYPEIESSLRAFWPNGNIDAFMSNLKMKALLDAKSYGYNYWKVVLYLALADSNAYKAYLDGIKKRS